MKENSFNDHGFAITYPRGSQTLRGPICFFDPDLCCISLKFKCLNDSNFVGKLILAVVKKWAKFPNIFKDPSWLFFLH